MPPLPHPPPQGQGSGGGYGAWLVLLQKAWLSTSMLSGWACCRLAPVYLSSREEQASQAKYTWGKDTE